MRTALRLLAPAALLGALLLLGERPTNPPDELPSASISAVADDASDHAVPSPCLPTSGLIVSLSFVRVPPVAGAAFRAGLPLPEARSLSPPAA